MRAVRSVQHIFFSLTSMIMFSVRCNLRRLSVCMVLSCPVLSCPVLSCPCPVLSLSLCFLQKLNGIMHYRPNWAILRFQTPPRSTVCILEQPQINTFNRQAISLPVIRSACPVLNTDTYKHRTDCPIWNWSGIHILSCEDAVRRMLHCVIPNRSLPKNKTLWVLPKNKTLWVRQTLL